jgi:hypothetical protein
MIPYELKIERMVIPQLTPSSLYHRKFAAATQPIHLKGWEVKTLAKMNPKKMQLAEGMQAKSGKAQQQGGQVK